MSVTASDYGYTKKVVNGKPLKLNSKMFGSEASSVARRKLSDSRVQKARVERTGCITLHLKGSNSFVIDSEADFCPDGWEVDRVHVHATGELLEEDRASAHVDIKKK